MSFTPRASQLEILKYQGGTMGISAVPGSGKTHTLSALAAELVSRLLHDQSQDSGNVMDTEVLVVTFSNSAVSNFSSRIAAFLQERDMIPGVGYHVRTLHSMAADIVRGRAESVGLERDFRILDETEALALLGRAVDLWMEGDGRNTFDALANPDLPQYALDKNFTENWRTDVIKMVQNVISQAKDYLISPDKMREMLPKMHFSLPILEMVCSIYENYALLLRGYPAVDYSDLMYYAWQVLQNDPEYLHILQTQWPYILEDEAQDSSMIQEKVLRLLTAEHHNWVRVGDPNQAINETFTTADPRFLREFLHEAQKVVDLQEAGRSARSVLRQANRLVKWSMESHPNQVCRSALVTPYIKMTSADDAQGNPADDPSRIVFDGKSYTPDAEIKTIAADAAKHVKEHPDETLVILTPSNGYGAEFIPHLEQRQVEVIEMLKSSRKTRGTADTIASVLDWLSVPLSAKRCAHLFDSLYHHKASGGFYLTPDDSQKARECLLSIQNLEDFFYPSSDDVLNQLVATWHISEYLMMALFSFRQLLKRWLDCRFQKIDQLILLIAQDIFTDATDLCTASQLGSILSGMLRNNPSERLNTLADKMSEIARNASLYPELRDVESQFDPALYRGKVVVTTYHKAKGLEWDQVYLTSCNTFDFPSGCDADTRKRKARPSYMRGQLDLQAEGLEQLRILAFSNGLPFYQMGAGSQKASDDSAAERLRLLYVGITRAKKGLHVSWNTGRFGGQHEALAVQTLRQLNERKETQ